MLFDKMLGIAENNLPELLPILTDAKLFVFPEKANAILPKAFEDQNMADYVAEEFRLPFPTVAIEDPATCIFLIDNHENHKGLISEPRKFIEISCSGTQVDNFDESQTPERYRDKLDQVVNDIGADIYTVGFGTIAYQEVRVNGFAIDGTLDNMFIFKKKKMMVNISGLEGRLTVPDFEMASNSIIRNAGVAIQELIYFNSPRNFVLEETPIAKRKSPKLSKKLKRSHERSVYTILSAKDIRKRMNLPDVPVEGNKRTSPRPHDRRGHIRFIKDMTSETQTRAIWVRPTWVGPDETIIGNKRYKIRLDL